MPNPALAIMGVASIGSSLISAHSASKASKAQVQSNNAAIAEQRAARTQLEQLLAPYTAAGTPALKQMMALAGAGGTDWAAYAQANPEVIAAYERQQQSGSRAIDYDPTTGQFTQGPGASLESFAENYYNTIGRNMGHDISPFSAQDRAVSSIENSPMFDALARQGEDAILQNASATGGLRGGNTQGALAQFRPSLLNQFIQQQYGRLAGLTEIGQNSAAGVGSAGVGVASNIGQIQMDTGAARAGNALAQGQIYGNAFGNLAGLIAGQLGGAKPAGATF